ncbi:helix-turn-helix domain-containing protein [Pseudonocardia sp. CA-107938]|uniref:helix-turn-helix transcriptional regulator n=1 Tax=Pseudonocardia sp. CA-107938 TaxID=3240021 RepID=UPI003D90A5D1
MTARRARLARARRAAGLTQEDLAHRVGVDRSTVGRWEAGESDPQPWARRKLAKVLGLPLDELAVALDDPRRTDATAAADEDAFDRLARAVEQPRRVDLTVVEHLAETLARQRKIEDEVGARAMAPAVLAEITLLERMAREARGPVRAAAVQLLAEYHQFAGWMGEDLGDHAGATAHYDRAMDAATETGDANMITSVLSMKSHLAWSLCDAALAVGLAAAGGRHPGAVSPGVLSLVTQQEARGHALDGNGEQVDRLLDRAERLSLDAAEHPEDEPPWVYFTDPGRVLFQRGVAYVELGRHARAVELFREARAHLGPSYRRDHGRYAARLALAAALDGRIDEATAAGREAVALALVAGGAHTVADLRRMRRALERWSSAPAVVEFDEMLADLA